MPTHSYHPTLLFITPTGMPHLKMIEQKIVDDGLRIAARDTFYPREDKIERFLLKRDKLFADQWRRFLLGNKCALFVIGGADAIRKTIALCGTSIVPTECQDGTLRHTIEVPNELVHGTVWFDTPVIPGRNRTELRNDLEVFEQEKFLDSANWPNGTH